jgi:hypothetical protein
MRRIDVLAQNVRVHWTLNSCNWIGLSYTSSCTKKRFHIDVLQFSPFTDLKQINTLHLFNKSE